MDIQQDQAKRSNLYDQLIDQYKLEAHITQTAVTDLYRAFDVDENRSVAIEILLPALNTKKQFVEQFIEKMNKVAQLKHPNIAQIYQIGITPANRPYVARDLVEGITLRERLRQLANQPSPANSIYALKIVRQLAEALELAERLDLYHHHLTPDNIMLKQDGTVVLVDLGIPATENGASASTSARHLSSTAPYLAPEKQNGKPTDSRSQIYTLAVILHEILTGELPNESSSYWQNFAQVINPKNTVLEEARPDLSRQTYALIEKSLMKQQWARYKTIQEFLEAINEALQNERMLIQTRGKTAVLAPSSPRRSRTVLLIPLTILLVLITFGVIWSAVRNQSTAEPTAVPVAIEPNSEETRLPTPTLNQTTLETTAAGTATVGNINLLAPADASEFQAGETADFRWRWDDALEENQRFSVYLLTDNGRSLLGTVSTPATDGTYSLQTLLPDSSSNALSEWQIVLEDTATNRDVITSNNRSIAIKPASVTPTFTPSPTETALPSLTPTATPLPRVVIFVPSASLRQGPGTIYPIQRYLYEGDVVTVIAKNDADGEWYTVILDDGSIGWVAASVTRAIDINGIDVAGLEIAATIPARPTNTPTPTPTNTPTPTATATATIPPNDGGGGGGGNPPSPTNTPHPTVPPLPTNPP